MGLGLTHYIPLVAYLGFWVMCLVSLGGRPLLGLYYLMPFIPYRTMRDHFVQYPLGTNVTTILVLCIIAGAIIHGKRLPKSTLYWIWLIFGIYMYFSLWIGTALGNAPAPLWINDINFATWKDYMLIPLIFAAAGMVIEDRKAIRTIIIITAVSLLFIDRSCVLESLSRSWVNFDEEKRGGGPLAFGSNQTAAFLAQFGMFYWGFIQFVKTKKFKLAGYGLVALTVFATMFTFSRAAYLALLISVLVLGILKDRKLLLVLGCFLLVWQAVVPTAVLQRVTMTENANGQLESSAEARVQLWEHAENAIIHSPIVGTGFATFQLGEHVDNLKDTHNWYVKVMVETGIIGLIMAIALLEQMFALSIRVWRRATDPLYRGLGLGLLLAMCSCAVANFFGDRWTYLEITGLLWILVAAAVRSVQLMEHEGPSPLTEDNLAVIEESPYAAYRKTFAPRS